jgi:hypothetical protein
MTYQRILIAGQSVTFERSSDSATGWCATGWEQGLPVCRKPIQWKEIQAVLGRFDPAAVSYLKD